MVDELARRVQALAAMTEEARGIGLRVEIEEESPKHNSKTAMEDIEAVL